MDSRDIKRKGNATITLKGQGKQRAWWIRESELTGNKPFLESKSLEQGVPTEGGY